jgi:uncharacterized protein
MNTRITFDTRLGFLRAASTPISKANVCQYRGAEIPDYERLGLHPKRLYRMWRHPGELAKAAPTFNNLPVLDEHGPLRTSTPIGWLGYDAKCAGPYLQNRVVVWSQDAIDDVRAGRRKELSAAYRYRPQMRSGKTPEGEPYDGIMRDIRGHHVALVDRGRAGPDVRLVMDRALNPRGGLTYETNPLVTIACDAAPLRETPRTTNRQETQKMGFKNPNDALAEPQGEHTEGYHDEDVGTDDSHAARLHAILSEHCPPEVMQQIGQILSEIAGEAEEGEEDVLEAEGEDEGLIHAKAGGIDYKTTKRRDALQSQDNPRTAQDARAGFLSNYGKQPARRPVRPVRRVAMDGAYAASTTDSYLKLFPSAAHIGRV